MNAIRLMVLTVICWCPVVAADNAPGSATTEVAALLREFIAGAGKGNPALFERFFADDVLYTRASGALVTKADILKSLRGAPPDEQCSYTAEDVTLHEHGDTVIVAFRLDATSGKPVPTGLIIQTGSPSCIAFSA